jgi:Cu+-exporting ATPase
MVATGNAARAGLLIRSGATLEVGHRIDTVVFDKTGTLTEGRPSVTGATWLRDDALSLAAAVERGSEHPFADAILRHAEAQGAARVEALAIEAHVGRGVQGRVGSQTVRVGVPAWVVGAPTDALPADVLATLAPDICERMLDDAEAGQTTLLVAIDGAVAGALTMTDAAKPTAGAAIAALRAQGIHTVLLSGDREETTVAMGDTLGIDEVYGGMRPDEKVAVITRLQASGRVVAMVGDGINDAGALAAANIGIAMAGGTDIAMGAADVTITSSDPAGVADVLALSRQTMRVIRQNLGWAFGYNVLGIPIAAGALFPFFGILLSPVFASVAMALSSVSVVTNSLRLSRERGAAGRS